MVNCNTAEQHQLKMEDLEDKESKGTKSREGGEIVCFPL